MDNNWSSIEAFNFAQFHWLAPNWLWMLMPLWLIGVSIIWLNRDENKWQHYIAKHLKNQVIQKGDNWHNQIPLGLFLLISSFLILGMAQPAWEKEKSPAMQIATQAIIAMEISPSMLQTDIKPSRLERAKLKVNDFLEAKPAVKVGLHVYGGSPHIVLPPTQDYHLIAHHVKSFKTSMMPKEGEDLALYLNLIADTVFKQFDSPATLVIVTDDWTPSSQQAVNQFVLNTNHQVKVLLVTAGFQQTQTLSKQIELIPITLDTTDVAHIAHQITNSKTFVKGGEELEDNWKNRGYLCLIPVFLLSLLFFRKGFTVLPVIVITILTGCDYNSEIAPYIYNHNTLAEAYYKAGEYQKTLTFSTNPKLRAAAYYHLGDYESAAQLFQLDTLKSANYNFALALTHLGYYDSALAVLKKANVDSTQIKSVIAYIDSNKFQVLEESKLFDDEDSKGSLIERKAKGKDEELTSDTETDELPKSGERVTDEVESEVHKAKEMEFPPDETDEGQEMKPKNILLQKSPSDPAEFLRKRFKLQYKRRKENHD